MSDTAKALELAKKHGADYSKLSKSISSFRWVFQPWQIVNFYRTAKAQGRREGILAASNAVISVSPDALTPDQAAPLIAIHKAMKRLIDEIDKEES